MSYRTSSLQGVMMLWRGMLPAILRHAVYTGTRMTAYEEIRSSLTKENKDGFPIWKKVEASTTSFQLRQKRFLFLHRSSQG